jgi:hypothetical protein
VSRDLLSQRGIRVAGKESEGLAVQACL